MVQLTDTLTLLEQRRDIYEAIERLIHHSLQQKTTVFSKTAFTDAYHVLKDGDFIREGASESFALNYERLAVCAVLMDIAERRMGETVPTDVGPCLAFADRFALEIRNPDPRTFWYEDLESQFKRYLLIYLNHIHHVDVTEFLYTITAEMQEANPSVRLFGMRYKDAFPFLLDDAETSFRVIQHLHRLEDTRWDALEALSRTGTINPQKAVDLLHFAQANDGVQLSGVLPNLIQGLFRSNPDHYLQEAFALFAANRIEGLHALTWIDYTQEDQTRQAFAFITSQPIADIVHLRVVPTFVTRLIKNEHTPADLKEAGFRLLSEYLEINDDELKHNLVWRLSSIDGYDAEKMALFPKVMAWGNTQALNQYFDHFDSPQYLFSFIKDVCIALGLKTNFELFKNGLQRQYHLHPDLFEAELLRFLTDNLALVRFAGLQILTSRYGGIYPVDLLRLPEQKQQRAIDTLLQLPTRIEELFPLALQLRNSPYETVREKLKNSLMELIWAYDRGLIELAEKHLSKISAQDRLLLEALHQGFATYEEEKELKKKVKEFNPIENELELVEQFFRLEQEKNAEMMEKASERSVFSQIGKTISVIRGSGFSMELNKDIAMLGKMEFSRLIDQRYSMNPEAYEWNFKMGVLGKNYSTEDEA